MRFVANISTVFQCASLCRADTNCSHWTLFKASGYCDLWESVVSNRTYEMAISGSEACGEVVDQGTATTEKAPTTVSELCQKMNEAFT